MTNGMKDSCGCAVSAVFMVAGLLAGGAFLRVAFHQKDLPLFSAVPRVTQRARRPLGGPVLPALLKISLQPVRFSANGYSRYNQTMRLMGIIAHPDDEGTFAGSLLLYRERGAETYLVCLTPGQAATHRGGAADDQQLSEMRRKEFANSCEILKVSRGVVLDYPDGKLHRIDLYNAVCELTRQVREFRPDVLITFGTEGGVTGHTDHSMAGVAGSLAFQWAGRNNRYPDQLRDGLQPHRTKKLYHPSHIFELSGRQPITFPPITATIEVGKYVEAKIQAFKSHTSQAPLWPIFEENVRKREPVEHFHLAARTEPGPSVMETDLFQGIIS